MTVWSKCDFDLAATQLAFLLCQYDDQCRYQWSYEHNCLVAVTTHEIKQIDDHHKNTQSAENVTSFDGDTIVFRNVQQTSDWFVTISYSHIWQVPVLHFTAQMQDGTPLSRDDVIFCILSCSNDPNSTYHVTSDFVSLDEHPVTGIPSYFLHPCRTTALLEILQASSDNPALRLWSWMSMILPLVGIVIRPSTFRRIQTELEGDDTTNDH